MDDMSPELRALTDSARRGDDPTDDDRARVRRALALKLGAAALGTGAAASAGATASVVASKGVFAAWWVKAGVAALLVASVATAVVVTRPKRAGAPVRVSAPSAVARVREAPASTETPVVVTPAVRVETPDAAVVSAPSAVVVRQTPRAREEASDLTEELAALREARRAMAAAEPERALEILDVYARAHRGGVMAVEREGARLIASCAAGRDVRAEAEAFVARHGDAPLASRVRAECVDR